MSICFAGGYEKETVGITDNPHDADDELVDAEVEAVENVHKGLLSRRFAVQVIQDGLVKTIPDVAYDQNKAKQGQMGQIKS